MKHIQTIEVGAGGAASIEFTSIPQTYTDLVILFSGRANVAQVFHSVYLNGSSTSRTVRALYGNGSSAGSWTLATDLVANPSDYTANVFGNSIIYIPNYTSSTNKSWSMDGVSENNATASFQSIAAGLWANTAAITSVTLYPNGGNNWVQYSSASLYGIKNS